MDALLLGMITIGGFCLLVGVVYPLVAILVYPIYRLLGGKQSLRDYVRCL